MNRSAKIVLAVTLACLGSGLTAPRASAQDDDVLSTEGAIWLLLPVSARAVSLGRAMTALPGPESVWWNPAGLGEAEENHVLLFRGDDLSGEATAASVVLARPGLGTLAVAYQLQDIGDQELRDRQGNSLGTISNRNHLGIVSLATRFLDRISVGINFKLVQTRFSCRGQCLDEGVTATTFAVDAGVQATDVGSLPLRLGASLAHAGPDFQFENADQADPLPTRIRVAAAFDVLDQVAETDELALWLTTELEERWEDPGSPALFVGSEFVVGLAQTLFVRTGYVLGSDSQVDGAAVGIGFQYESFDLSIAKSLAQTTLQGDNEPVHVSFGFVF